MKLTLGSNIPALGAKRRLDENSTMLSRVFERLASGQRINSAGDDAAGLALADSLRTDSRLYSQAVRNINDGVSLLNVMEGAVEAQSQVLTRMQELAQQSANGTYTYQQRRALQDEYESLQAEFTRIAESTEYNGMKLLDDPDTASLFLQAGINSDASSLIELLTAQATGDSGVVNVEGDFASAFGDIDIFDLLDLLGFQTGDHTIDELQEYFGTGTLTATITDNNGVERNLLIVFSDVQNTDGPDGGATTIMVFAENLEGDGTYSYTTLDGFTINEDGEVTIDFLNTDEFNGLQLTLNLGDIDFNSITYSGAAEETAIQFTNILGVESAKHALGVLENRREVMSSLQGQIGAVQSRLQSALSSVQTTSLELQTAEARIRDADIAGDVAELVRRQILQQSSAAVLAQANIQPQLALLLLSALD